MSGIYEEDITALTEMEGAPGPAVCLPPSRGDCSVDVRSSRTREGRQFLTRRRIDARKLRVALPLHPLAVDVVGPRLVVQLAHESLLVRPKQ